MSRHLLSRREALLTLLREHTLDYVPASTYGVDRYSHPWMAADPSFEHVLTYTDEHDHIFALHLSYYASFGFTDVLGVPDLDMAERHTYHQDGATHYEFTLHTPQGDLTAHYTEKDDVHTVWRHGPLIKSNEDIDHFLSVPFAPSKPDVEAFQQTRQALGERGVMEIEIPDPLCVVVENMSYEDFMLRSAMIPEKIDAMLDKVAQLVYSWVESLLQAGFGPVFRIFGPEYAAPPIMSPTFFEKAVVTYDCPLVDLIHHYGSYVRYHCHGPINRIVGYFLDLGVDMTDPCEAPPSGDITLRELANRVGRELILVGNIQLDDLERATPEKIDRLVAEAVDAVGGRVPFILCPTAPPFHSPLSSVTERNVIQFLASAEKYGA